LVSALIRVNAAAASSKAQETLLVNFRSTSGSVLVSIGTPSLFRPKPHTFPPVSSLKKHIVFFLKTPNFYYYLLGLSIDPAAWRSASN